MPHGLDIDQTSTLDGTVAPYDLHVVIRTGRSDWPSRIEDDERLPYWNIAKEMLGRKGKYHNPYRNVLFSTSSHEGSLPAATSPEILIFPRFTSTTLGAGTAHELTNASRATAEAQDPTALRQIVEDTIRQHILPAKLSPREKKELPEDRQSDLISTASDRAAAQSTDLTGLKVLICGHGKRDERCGVLGPILQREFQSQLERHVDGLPRGSDWSDGAEGSSVELISHIGGHKFAGNVILYFPTLGMWEKHPLSGMGIWLGRVRPEHVEGILKETVLKGRIIKELFRGGIDAHSGTLRLENLENKSSDI